MGDRSGWASGLNLELDHDLAELILEQLLQGDGLGWAEMMAKVEVQVGRYDCLCPNPIAIQQGLKLLAVLNDLLEEDKRKIMAAAYPQAARWEG